MSGALKKITLVGNFLFPYSSESQYVVTLRELGHEVFKLQEGTATAKDILASGLNSDLLIFIHSHHLSTQGEKLSSVFKKLKKRGIPVITYHLDLWFGLERQKDLNDDYYKELSYFFTVDKLMADWFNKNTKVKGYFIPAGVFDREAVMLKAQRVRYSIVFTGSSTYHPEFPYRIELVEFLKKTYGDRFIHIGNGGQVAARRGMELNQIYRNARITVGDTLNIGFNYPYYSSDRLFEQTGRGAFTIYPHIKGIDDWFVDGKEIVTYKHGDLQDLRKKIDYYLLHAEEREKIRQAGFERARKDHTYRQRWIEILNEVFKDESTPNN